MGKEFKAVRLPEELVDELQLWREAYSRHSNRGKITFEFMVREMLDQFLRNEPGVVDEMRGMVGENPGLADKLSFKID